MLSITAFVEASLGIVAVVGNDRLAKAFIKQNKKYFLSKEPTVHGLKTHMFFRSLFIGAGVLLLLFAVLDYLGPNPLG